MTASKAPETAPRRGHHSARKKDVVGKKGRKKGRIGSSEQEETTVSESSSVEKVPCPPSSPPEENSDPHEIDEVDVEKPPPKKKKTKKTHTGTREQVVGDVGDGSLPAANSNEKETGATGNDATTSDAEEAAEEEKSASETIVYRENEIIDSSQSFKDFAATHLDRRLTKAIIDDLKLHHPTHVQSKRLLQLQQQQTGSGKTLAYVLPLLQRLLQLQQQQQQRGETVELPPLCALILVPTKELCIQVYDVLTALLKYTKDVVTVSHTASPDGTSAKSLGPPTVMLSQLQNLMLHKPLIIRVEEEESADGGPGGANPIGEFYFQVPTEAEKWLVAYAFLRLGLVPLKCLVFCKDVSRYVVEEIDEGET
ncbi:hypothetical protein, conserved [Eimeria praecox]|uniref:ATP-dependent RNA helicase n=1 Tax=Eimeria praecox TaxID=51316 RepID=U6GIA0_9EIME|nr:hypothetical protein, conserved [Eimeria praecox]